MAGVKAQANWTTVGWNSLSFTKVDSVEFDFGGSIEEYAGDLDIYPTLMVALSIRPSATLHTTDVGQIAGMGASIGTSSTLTATHKDAKLTVGGDLVYSMSNAVLETVTTGGEHAKFGKGQAKFRAYSSDGTTSPLGVTYTAG